MLIATFVTSGWTGKRVTFENKRFVLEDQGDITAHDVLWYYQQGYLEWAPRILDMYGRSGATTGVPPVTSLDTRAGPAAAQSGGAGGFLPDVDDMEQQRAAAALEADARELINGAALAAGVTRMREIAKEFAEKAVASGLPESTDVYTGDSLLGGGHRTVKSRGGWAISMGDDGHLFVDRSGRLFPGQGTSQRKYKDADQFNWTNIDGLWQYTRGHSTLSFLGSVDKYIEEFIAAASKRLTYVPST